MIKLKEIVSSILSEAQLRGEWWIQDGQAIFADGDVGDMNHEGYVIETLKREILERMGVDASRYEYIPDFNDKKILIQIKDAIGEDLTDDEKVMWDDDDLASVIISYLKRNGMPDIEEKWKYAMGSGDAREYALVNWGWQRVRGNVIQTQTLTSQDIKNITSGLYEAYSEELNDMDETRISETNPKGEHTFNIEVMSTRSYYEDIPWSVLAKDDPTALNPYRTRY